MSESQTSIQLPVLDMAQPLNPSTLFSVSLACKEWGFFYVSNHGISEDFYKRLYSLVSHIFCLPSEVKLKAAGAYTPHFIASPFFESLRVSGPDFFASATSSSEAILQQPNPELSVMLQEYGSKMTYLSKRIVEVVLACLGADVGRKLVCDEFDNCHGYVRINKYTAAPDCMKKEEEEDDDKVEVEGLGVHTDMSCITIVYQDEHGGLQVRSKEGKWMDIPPLKDTLVLNIGDLLQAWSNGRLRSSEHRVVLRPYSLNRFSIAFFWCFEDDKMIYAPKEVVGIGNQRFYKPFVCAHYLKFRESDETGKFEKVGYNVKHFAGASI